MTLRSCCYCEGPQGNIKRNHLFLPDMILRDSGYQHLIYQCDDDGLAMKPDQLQLQSQNDQGTGTLVDDASTQLTQPYTHVDIQNLTSMKTLFIIVTSKNPELSCALPRFLGGLGLSGGQCHGFQGILSASSRGEMVPLHPPHLKKIFLLNYIHI